MKTRRILSVLIAALMILPMAIMGVGADTPATPAGTVLYEENYGNTAYASYDAAALGLREWGNGSYGNAKDQYTYGLVKQGEGDYGLLLSSNAGNSSVEFFSAKKMQAANAQEPITSYVLSADLTVPVWTGSPWIGFHVAYDFNTAEDAPYVQGSNTNTDNAGAIWALRDYQDFGIQTLGKYPGGSSWVNTKTGTGHADGVVNAGVEVRVVMEVNVEEGVAQTYLYMTAGGELDYHRIQTFANDTFKTLGGFAFHGCYIGAIYDNVTITRGTIANPGTTIYSNDFDALAEGRDIGNLANIAHNTAAATTPKATANIVTMDGNNALRLLPVSTANNWTEGTGAEIVPASAFDGFNGTKYTVEMDLRLDNIASTSIWVQLGGVASPKVRIGQYDQGYFLGCDAPDGFQQWPGLQNTNKGKFVTLVIEADTATGTGKVSIKGSTEHFYNIAVPTTLGAINLIVGCKQVGFVDNVRVTAGTPADAPADYYGAQAALNTNGIRFVGTLGKAYNAETVKDLTAVGFHITAKYAGGELTFDQPCTKILNKLNGSVSGTVETYTAAELGGAHIFALTIKDIPASAGVVTFVVTPYFTTEAGEATGTTWTVVYDAATNTIVSQTMN